MLAEKISVLKFQRRCDPIVDNCWYLYSPITNKDINNAIHQGELLSPDNSVEPISKSEHISRIAWFVVNGWTEPIQIDVGVPSFGCNPKWPLEDGNHRFAASIIRKDTIIEANMSGAVDIIRTFLWIGKKERNNENDKRGKHKITKSHQRSCCQGMFDR